MERACSPLNQGGESRCRCRARCSRSRRMSSSPRAPAAELGVRRNDLGVRRIGIDEHANHSGAGTSSRSSSSRFGPSELRKKLIPVTLPPGRLSSRRGRLRRDRRRPGKTIGIVAVARWTHGAAPAPPVGKDHVHLATKRSSIPRRSREVDRSSPSAQRYSMSMF